MEALSDGELLARSAGDREAFTAFYRRYERPVLAYLGRRVGDAQLAADLCAEVFAAALAGAAAYRPERETAAQLKADAFEYGRAAADNPG